MLFIKLSAACRTAVTSTCLYLVICLRLPLWLPFCLWSCTRSRSNYPRYHLHQWYPLCSWSTPLFTSHGRQRGYMREPSRRGAPSVHSLLFVIAARAHSFVQKQTNLFIFPCSSMTSPFLPLFVCSHALSSMQTGSRMGPWATRLHTSP